MLRFRVSVLSEFGKLPEIVAPAESESMMRKMKIGAKM